MKMKTGFLIRSSVIAGLALIAAAILPALPSAQAPLTVDSGRVTVAGTSSVHEWSASTPTIHVVRAQLAQAAGAWDAVLQPGVVQAFEVAIPASTLTSPKEGLDKNMHKALKTEQHPDITFKLLRFDGASAGAAKAIGVLQIAGVEHEVTLDITLKPNGATLAVQGRLDLLMTDYGITPPKAMLGMLKTDPKVTVTFETVLAVPLN